MPQTNSLSRERLIAPTMSSFLVQFQIVQLCICVYVKLVFICI